MKKLICTSYNKLSDGSLVLRSNWTENIQSDEQLIDYLNNWNIILHLDRIKNLNKISDIFEGASNHVDNVKVHIRIITF